MPSLRVYCTAVIPVLFGFARPIERGACQAKSVSSRSPLPTPCMPLPREPFQRFDDDQHVSMDYEGKPAYSQVPTGDEDNPRVGEEDNSALLKGELQHPADSAGFQHGFQVVSTQDEAISSKLCEPEGTPDALSSQYHHFERPDIHSLAIYTLCCATIYPFLNAVTLLCRERSLFEVRLLVGLGCTTVALVMGFFLQKFAKRFIEASTWATLLQQNGSDVRDRMTLHELSELSSDPTSVLAAIRLLQIRHRIRRTRSEKKNRHMWYSYLVFFSLLVGTAGTLSFVLGRIVNIVTETSFDHRSFEEVPIFGDLTEGDTKPYTDVESIRTTGDGPAVTLNNLNFGWTEILPSWRYGVQLYTASVFGNDTVYFAEPYAAQLRTDGFALGGLSYSSKLELLEMSRRMPPVNEVTGSSTGMSVIHYPQWGLRVACEKLPNPDENLVPDTNGTTVHLPHDFVAHLYSRLDVPFVEENIRLSQPIRSRVSTDNITSQSDRNSPLGTLTSLRIELSDPVIYGNGTPVLSSRTLASYVTDYGGSGAGWTIFDVFLMRFSAINAIIGINDNRHAPLVSLPVWFGDFGYDSVACVQRVDAWLIEVYNSTRVITDSKLIGKLASVDDHLITARRKPGTGDSVEGIVRSLRSENKSSALFYGYERSIRSWFDQSGGTIFASPLDVSFTDGIGSFNFTSLDAARVQEFRAVHGATVILPFLSGSQQIVARRYEGLQVAFAHVLPIPMAIAIATLFLAGVIGCTCIPALPNGFPQRRFDLYSWVTAMEGDGLKIVTAGQDDSEDASLKQGKEEGAPDWHAGMQLELVEKAFGPLPVEYSVEAK